MKFSRPLKFLISLMLPQLAGFAGSAFTFSAIPVWYAFLEKPSFAPPNWVFAPVWLTLYALMGVAFYLVWISKKKEKIFALKVFLLHLLFNAFWSLLFFGLKNLGLAFLEIIFLWGLILYTTALFYKIDKRTLLLLVPYILWVSFASFLNYSIWMLN